MISCVAIASMAAFHVLPGAVAYNGSKAAVAMMTKSLAREWARHGINVNAICPGSVEGPRIERVIQADAEARGISPSEVEREYKSQSSMRVFATNDDIIAMIEFLTSPAGARVSGQAIAIDGHTEGLSLRMEN
jgi:NAD(P)-dependent dehydrogenase (short-subunit alcohol dehydrogenase family)